MELDKFHILQWQASAQDHAAAIAGAGMRRSCGEIGAAIATSCQHDSVALKPVYAAIFHAHGDHAAAFAIFHDEVEGEIFNEEIRVIFQALLIQSMQHRVTGTVGCRCGTLYRRAFAHILHMAAKGPLVDSAVGVARKWHAGMFQFIDRSRCLTHHIFDGILVTEPIGALNRVIHVPGPMVRRVVAKRCRNPALRRDSVRTRWEYLGNASRFQTRFRTAHGSAQTRTASADNDGVIYVVNNLISVRHQAGAPVNASFATTKMPNTALAMT